MKKEEQWTPHIIAVAAFVVFIVLGLACVSTGDTTPPPVAGKWQGSYDVVGFTAPFLPGGTIIRVDKDSITGEGLNITNVSVVGGESRLSDNTPPMPGQPAKYYSWVYLYSGSAKIGLAYSYTVSGFNVTSTDYIVLGKSGVEKFLAGVGTLSEDSVIPDTTGMGDTYVGTMVESGSRALLLNGTWVNPEGTTEYTFNNGVFSASVNGSPTMRGSYTTSSPQGILGTQGTVTIRRTHVHSNDMSPPGLYTKRDLRRGLVDSGRMTEAEFTSAHGAGDNFSNLSWSYNFKDNELTLAGVVYKRK